MNILFTIAELVAIVPTLTPLIRSDAWWIRILDFSRILIAIIGALILAADLAFRTDGAQSAQVIGAALALSVVFRACKIRSYTIFALKQVQPAEKPRKDSTLGLLLANVKMENRNSARRTEIIHESDPDVILIVEADPWWQSELDSFAETHPFTVQQPQDNTYGILLYSKLELVRPEAWSQTTLLFQKIGLVDPRIGGGLYNSFHAGYFFLRLPLDHFFHSTHFRLIELKRLAYFGSDHFRMYIRLSYETAAQGQQKAPEAGASDRAQATEKIQEAIMGSVDGGRGRSRTLFLQAQ